MIVYRKDEVICPPRVLETECFHCYKPIAKLPCLLWFGGDWLGLEEHPTPTPPILVILHPPCAVDLMLRIGRDVHEIECKTGVGVELTKAGSRLEQT